MAKAEYPTRHGDQHASYGSDPIPDLVDAIRFDVDNEGGYLSVTANDRIPASDTSILLKALEDGGGNGGDFEITAQNHLFLDSTDGDIDVTAANAMSLATGGGAISVASNAGAIDTNSGGGNVSTETGGGGYTVDSGGGGLDVLSGGGGILINSAGGSGGQIEVKAWDGSNNGVDLTLIPGTATVLDVLVDGDVSVKLATGKKLTIKDHSNNPIFEVRDDGTIHIKTGSSITADL